MISYLSWKDKCLLIWLFIVLFTMIFSCLSKICSLDLIVLDELCLDESCQKIQRETLEEGA